MNYKYSIHHSRGKSDTNFYNEKSILDGAYSSLKALNFRIVNDIDKRHSNNVDLFLSKRTKSKRNKMKKLSIISDGNNKLFTQDSSSDRGEIILTLLERVLLFKKELDIDFFDSLKCVKFHLDNILQIMNSEVKYLKNKLIKECPKLKKCRLIRLLSVFSEVIISFIDTKPQEFYREIKDAIINQWEANRIKINEFFEALKHNTSMLNKSDSSSLENKSLAQEYIQIYEDINKDKLTADVKKKLSDINTKLSDDDVCKNEDIVLYLLSKKKEINHFLFQLSQGFFFTISKLYYEMDYYSSVISSVTFKIFCGIISFFNTNKDNKESCELSKQRKIYHIIDHIVNLARTFNQSIKTGEISLENGSFNSMCKFILNNFCEIMPKCGGIKDPEIITSFSEKSLFQNSIRIISYKSYLQRYNRFTDKQLLRIFRNYYNSKLFFWKSIVSFSAEDASTTFTCRICEKKIPLNESSLHVNYCKEQKLFYERMKSFKKKFQSYINDLECYLTKINQNLTSDDQNKFIFGKGGLLHNIINRLPDCKDDENGEVFLKSLIRLYKYENSKPVDYYENKPEELSYIISLGYFTLILFLFCKLSNGISQELNGIFGGVFSLLLQNLINIQIFLFLKKCKIKNNVIKGEKPLIQLFKKPIRKIKSSNPQLHEYINMKKNKKKDNEDDLISPSFNFRALIQKYKSKLSLNNMILSNQSSSFGNSVNKSSKMNKRINSIDAKTKKHKKNQKSEKIFKKREKYKSMTKHSSPVKSRENNIRHMTKNSANSCSKIKMREYLFSINDSNLNNSNEKNCNNSFLREPSPNIKRQFSKRRNSVKCAESTKVLILKGKKTDFLVLDDLNKNKPTRVKSCGNIYFDVENNDKKDDKDNSVGSSIMLCGIHKEKEYSDDYSESGSSYEFEPHVNSSNNLSKDNTSFFGSFKSLNRKDDVLQSNIIGENEQIFSRNVSNIQKKHQNKNDINSSNNSGNNNLCVNKMSLFSSGTTKSTKDNNKKETNNIKTSFFLSDKKSSFVLNNLGQKGKKNILNESNSHSSNISNISKEDSNDSILMFHKNGEKIRESSSSSNKKEEDNFEDIFVEGDSNDSSELSDEEENEEDEDSFHLDKVCNPKSIFPKLLYYDPETQNMINQDQITIIYEELIKNLDEKLISLICEKENVNICNECDENPSNFFLKSSSNSLNELKLISPMKNRFNNSITKSNNNSGMNNISLYKEKEDEKKNQDELKPKKSKFEHQAIENNSKELPECKVSNKISISDFKLILPIAKGGYGSVGLYKKASTGDFYAIKIVHISAMKEKKLSSTLKTEQKILKEIDNDYVVNSYFIFGDEKNYYFVMEYLPGGDVYKLLSSIILPEDTIKLIVAETILAVIYLHRIKIIHHDIKPENILITQTGHFKLSDFGLSKSIEANNEKEKEKINKYVKNFQTYVDFNKDELTLDSDTEENQAVGTLPYMAPELFTDEYPKGIGIDYWAVGVVIFELYTFKVPFGGKDQDEVIKNIKEININWEPLMSEEIKNKYKNVDAAIDLIKKFLVKNPNDRWGDSNLVDIKKHKFFQNFNWDHISSIRSVAVRNYLKKLVDETNLKIKQANNQNNSTDKKEDFPLVINLTKNEEEFHFTERLDNLGKRNNELIRMKIKKKEIKIEDNNFRESTLLDLE